MGVGVSSVRKETEGRKEKGDEQYIWGGMPEQNMEAGKGHKGEGLDTEKQMGMETHGMEIDLWEEPKKVEQWRAEAGVHTSESVSMLELTMDGIHPRQ